MSVELKDSLSAFTSFWIKKDSERKYKELPIYPIVRRDLSIVTDNSVSPRDIILVIEKTSGQFLHSIRLFDYYPIKDKQKKSYTFNIDFQSKDNTFTDEEINRIQSKIIKQLNKELKAELRS